MFYKDLRGFDVDASGLLLGSVFRSTTNGFLPFSSVQTTRKMTPPQTTQIDAAIAIVVRSGKILVCQRKDDDTFGGYWEFPGGKQEDGESLEECLARELREELNIAARPISALAPVVHDYPEAMVRLHPFLCEHESGEPQLIECQAARWINPVELRDYRFPPANEGLIEEIILRMLCA
jgi:mutator protein MutT